MHQYVVYTGTCLVVVKGNKWWTAVFFSYHTYTGLHKGKETGVHSVLV